MAGKQNNAMWVRPWGYSESITVVTGILVIGFALQITIGPFDFYLLAYPVNIIAGTSLIAICGYTGIFCRKKSFTQWISGIPLSVSLIGALILLTIIMGSILQVKESQNPYGVDAMTSNWAFILIYILILVSLGITIFKRLRIFNVKDYAFVLNHTGLWLFMAASGLGYADMERYIMHVREGETEWRVYDGEGNIKELPVAILLNDFDMDVYPPKLALIDRTTGEVQPKEKPALFQIDPDITKSNLQGWHIEVEEYIHHAIRNSDSTYREMPMPGATPAVKIRASKNDTIHEGWISAGNQAQLPETLPVDNRFSMVMTVAEPRIFRSDIIVYTADGVSKHKVIEVNSPLSVGSWNIYQHGYDNTAGRLSAYSSFELVYDPWIIPVYIGIFMLMAGSLTMLWSGRKGKEGIHDLE